MRPISTLSFDLGSITGWARSNCVLQPQLKISVVDHGTIYLDPLTNDRMSKDYNEIYNRRRVKLLIFEEMIGKLIGSQGIPDAILVEDVFCNPSRISAYRALILYLETLERITNVNYKKRLISIPTKVCKMAIAETGSADKLGVQSAVLNNTSITVKKPEKLSEHSSDAIAVAYAFAKYHLNL